MEHAIICKSMIMYILVTQVYHFSNRSNDLGIFALVK